MRPLVGIACAVAVAACLVPDAAWAQGRGNGRPKSPQAPAPQPAAESTSALTSSPVGTFPTVKPQFGSWLDDASTWSRGAGATGIGVGYWQGSGVRQINAPILNVNYGVTNRAQVGATVPFYRVSYLGVADGGLDDLYFNGKFSLVDPSDGRFGLALGTVIEVLGSGQGEMSRLHWAVPISLEIRGNGVRAYGSTGYFSRGAFFGAAAVEWSIGSATFLSASLAHSVSTNERTLTTSGTHLTDAMFYVARPLARSVSVYGGAGQTFTREARSLALSAGVSFAFSQ